MPLRPGLAGSARSAGGDATPEVLAADIGGTHARFAIAARAPDGAILLSHLGIRPVAAHDGPASALIAWARNLDRPLPRRLVLAVACPPGGERLQPANSPWEICPAALAEGLGLELAGVLNDAEAVARALPVLPEGALVRLFGPDRPLSRAGIVSVLVPGTGLGAAIVLRTAGAVQVVATEAGHIGFAPADPFEDRLVEALRTCHGRVSVERIVSGPGLRAIRAELAGGPAGAAGSGGGDPGKWPADDAALWDEALSGRDRFAAEALSRWCACLGAVAGDLLLAHGAAAVVLAGRLVGRAATLLSDAAGPFRARFLAKGRFRAHMEAASVVRLVHPEPGLLGAAAVVLAPA